MMGERQEVTTADLAGQSPTDPRDTNRSDLIEEADLERPGDLTPEDLAHYDVAPKELAPRDFAPRDPPSTRSQAARP
jgi:hypothetical protein